MTEFKFMCRKKGVTKFEPFGATIVITSYETAVKRMAEMGYEIVEVLKDK